MRTKFQDQLDALTDRLASMCHLAGQAIEVATDALVRADLPAAERVFDLNEQIEALRGPCEEQAMTLLALQAPVARDLRQVITGVHLVADLSRMGGLAQHVAESVRRRYPNHVTSGEAEQLLGRMGRLAGGLAGLAEQVLWTRDPELAAELDRRDDELDSLHRELLDLTQDPAWTDSVTVAVDVTLLGRFYERFGDYTVVVGRRVIFLVTGKPMAQYALHRCHDRWGGGGNLRQAAVCRFAFGIQAAGSSGISFWSVSVCDGGVDELDVGDHAGASPRNVSRTPCRRSRSAVMLSRRRESKNGRPHLPGSLVLDQGAGSAVGCSFRVFVQ
jgi:phosphate transport system protein